MGSRRQSPGRCVEDNFAGGSSTLGEVGEAAQPAVANPANAGKDLKKETKSKDATQQNASAPKVVPHVLVSHLRSCTRQLMPRSHGCRLRSARWAMRTWSRKSIWNELSCVRRIKPWCLPCQHRSFQRRDIHRAREETVGCCRGGGESGCPESRRMSRRFGAGREKARRIAGAREEPVCTRPRSRGRVESSPSASGRVARIDESCRQAHKAEGRPRRDHASIGSSRVVCLDGRPVSGRAGSTHQRRPQSRHRTEFVVDERSRTHGGDEFRTTQTTNFGLVQHPERVGSPLTNRKMFSQVRSEG